MSESSAPRRDQSTLADGYKHGRPAKRDRHPLDTVVEESIEDLHAELRLYPDVYSWKVVDAILAAIAQNPDLASTAALRGADMAETTTADPTNRDGLCDQANGMLLSGQFPLLQECALPAGHRLQQAHRSANGGTAWRQDKLSGSDLARATELRTLLRRVLAGGKPAPRWALDHHLDGVHG